MNKKALIDSETDLDIIVIILLIIVGFLILKFVFGDGTSEEIKCICNCSDIIRLP